MIAKFFIERPVLANVLAVLMIVIGAAALFTLPVAQYPDIVPPTVQVTTRYPGASARTVVDTVALPIEQQVNGVEDMLYMQSLSSSDGSYTLTVTFKIGVDLNFAQILVQNRVSSALAQLPQSVQNQGVTVQKRSTSILMFVTLTSPDARFDSLYLANYATISLKDELARLPGVGNISVFGAGQYSMRVWLDPDQLYARGLVPQDIIQALQQQSQQVTAGQVGAPPTPAWQAFQYTLNVSGRLDDPSQFENVIVKTGDNGEITRVRDVGRVELGAQTYGQTFQLNGKPAAGIAYTPAPGTSYENMLRILSNVPMGQFMRDIHRLAAEGMVVAVWLHMGRTYLTGSYKKPRQFTWATGVILLILTIGLSYTGYLLPWDQLSYWAVTIGASMADAAPPPEVGKAVALLLKGAPDLGAGGLLRFYLLHVFAFPLIAILFIFVHYYKVVRHGHSLPPGLETVGEDNARKVSVDKRVPFLPDIFTNETAVVRFDHGRYGRPDRAEHLSRAAGARRQSTEHAAAHRRAVVLPVYPGLAETGRQDVLRRDLPHDPGGPVDPVAVPGLQPQPALRRSPPRVDGDVRRHWA